ncbi:alpha/beta hydrolase [Kiloniella laminariae]|uniref:Alpha/beta hydrolase n=1 Tax=Kiloniella laminariae TaxID=454162 RepID=A0ABT4LDV5_9PROT|nr:alpha/beta hydrolase [Kiloniella laminariae]MCZ4279280.1 alpha/beta hydrolase [Kiloniella laminariae]
MLELNHRFLFAEREVAWGVSGQGDPLVLIHGTPFSSQVWRNIAPLLAQKWTVYYFDLLGYGQSDKTAGADVSLGIQNRLLNSLLAHWNLEKPEVLCHDFGGATALRAYYLNGLRYRRLTLVDPVALAPWGSPFVQHVRTHEVAFAGLPDYAHEALLTAYLQGAAHNRLSEETLQIYKTPWQGDIGRPAFYRQISQMDTGYTDEIEPLYGKMSCPVRILWGEEDQWIPVKQGQKLAKVLEAEKFQIVPGSGHLMQEDRPEAIVAAMLA